MVAMALGALLRMARDHSLSSRWLFMAMDHSSGSMGGMPAVCSASVRSVTVSRAAPGTEKSGK